jgi:hypothetical protein
MVLLRMKFSKLESLRYKPYPVVFNIEFFMIVLFLQDELIKIPCSWVLVIELLINTFDLDCFKPIPNESVSNILGIIEGKVVSLMVLFLTKQL